MRNNDDLASSRGIVRFDLDVLLHKYITTKDGKGTRDIQSMMFIEIKTFMANPSEAQRDTLHLLNQILRNKKPNIHSTPRWQPNTAVTTAYSLANKRNIRLRLYGGHLLQLEKTSPENSDCMYWDREYPIGPQELVELMTFVRDPDNPERLLDYRRRSKPFSIMKTLFET